MHGIASDTNGSISLFSVVQRSLHRIKVVDVSSWCLLLLIAGSNVDASIKLSEALLPRIWIDRVFYFHEVELAGLRVEERKVVLEDDHVQPLPELSVVSDCLAKSINSIKNSLINR